jgi:hypothetical protein
LSWLVGDALNMIQKVILLIEHWKKSYKVKQIYDIQKNIANSSGNSNRIALAHAEEEYKKVTGKERFNLYLGSTISVFELIVSLHYTNYWKTIFRFNLHDGHVGASGVISSTLIMFEGLLKAIDADDEEQAALAIKN